MYDIVSWFGEVIAAFLAIMILVFVTLLCVARGRSRAYTSEVLPSPTEIALNLQKLSSELAAVTDWFSLGLNFGLQKHELTKIERDYQGNDRRRVEMLDLWLHRTPNATWEDVVRALQQMGENTVAEIIREKYIRGRSKLTEPARPSLVASAQKIVLQHACKIPYVPTQQSSHFGVNQEAGS